LKNVHEIETKILIKDYSTENKYKLAFLHEQLVFGKFISRLANINIKEQKSLC
jgi:hypothetical protein